MDGSQRHLSNDSFSYSWIVNLRPSLHYALEGSLRASLDASSDEASNYIEIDPTSFNWSFKRTSISSMVVDAPADFNFTTTLPPVLPPYMINTSSQHPPPLALQLHADQIFSNGLILPLHLLHPTKPAPPGPLQVPLPGSAAMVRDGLPPPPPHHFTPPSTYTSSATTTTAPAHSSLFRKWQRCTRRIVRKYLGFLRPPCRTPTGKRTTTTQDGAGKLVEPAAAGTSLGCVVHHYSCITTPRTSSTTKSFPFAAGDLSHHHHNVLFDADLETSIYDAVLHCKKSIRKL